MSDKMPNLSEQRIYLEKTNMQLAFDAYFKEEMIQVIYRSVLCLIKGGIKDKNKKDVDSLVMSVFKGAFYAGWNANFRRMEIAVYQDFKENLELSGKDCD